MNERAAEFAIAETRIAPGSRANIAIPASHLVTGFSANLALQIVHGAKPGPAVFVSAAIHGATRSTEPPSRQSWRADRKAPPSRCSTRTK